MPTQRLSMRRIKEVLQLKHVQGLPERAIARTLGISNGVAHGYLTRARAAGLSWPLPEGMTDEDLELLLFLPPRPASQSPQRPVPDWSYVDKELRRRNVIRRASPMSMRPIARPTDRLPILQTSRGSCRSMAMPAMASSPSVARFSSHSAGRIGGVTSTNLPHPVPRP